MVRSIFYEGAEFTSGGYPDAIKATGTADANGIDAYSDNNYAVAGQGNSPNSAGVYGYSEQGIGIIARSESQCALYAIGPGTSFGSDTGDLAAIYASGGWEANGITVVSDNRFGVHAIGGGANAFDQVPITQAGVYAQGGSADGVYAVSDSAFGVHAIGGGANAFDQVPITQAGVYAQGGSSTGVYATSDTGTAVFASGTEIGVVAEGTVGVTASGSTGPGVNATSISGIAVEGSSQTATGVQGSSLTATGVSGITDSGIGVTANGGAKGVALQVIGKIEVQGNSAGTVHMASGATTLTVTNPVATANSLIFLTPLENPEAFLWVAARSAGHFRIDASAALPHNVSVMFLIIN